MKKLSPRIKKLVAAFTLIELLVSVGIFAFMTALTVAKYGNFNQSVLLTNLAYDVAVTIRTAQSYGLSVKGSEEAENADKFQNAYGVYFDDSFGDGDTFILFADYSGDNVYDEGEEVSTYKLKRGAKIQYVCASNGNTCSPSGSGDTQLDITFKRPDPSAKIYINNDSSTSYAYAQITIKGTDDNIRVVKVRENGQISVGE